MSDHSDIRREPRYGSIPVIRRMRQRSNLNVQDTGYLPNIQQFENNILPIDQYQTADRDDAVSFFTEKSGVETNESQTYIHSVPYQKSAFQQSVRGPYIVGGSDNGEQSPPGETSESIFRRLIWPTFIICVPMLALSAVLLTIIFKYLVKPIPNIFEPDSEHEIMKDHTHLMVNFSATELVFLASFLSTTAPILAGCIMSLVAVLVYRELAKASSALSFPTLPTPYQMSLLIGVLSASYEQLYNSLTHLLSRNRRARTSPVLLFAIIVFLLSLLLGIAVALTDAYLHITTRTINVVLYSEPPAPSVQLGRGLNSYCLGIDRLTDNYGFPCSWAMATGLAANTSFQNGQFEMQRLIHNSSTQSQIQLANFNDSDVSTMAFIAPVPADLPDQTNYHANTIGVGVSCKLIAPTLCNLTHWGPRNTYTSFNCSSQFWGTLGAPPLLANAAGNRPDSSNLSFLALNPTSNLIYNYFADQDLEIVYNTADLNGTAQQGPDWTPWPDSELKNTIYAAYAWRSGISNFPGWSKNGMFQSNLVQKVNGTSYVDYFVKCEVSAYDVNYTWSSGSLQNTNAAKYENGSMLNIWTGLMPYIPGMGDGGSRLTDYTTQSTIAGNSTTDYEQKFGELIATDALSAIGAYTSKRTVLQQQSYHTALLAKVPKVALGLLLACSLFYPLAGIILVICAGRAIRKTGPVFPLFSFWGLTWAAFVESSAQDEISSTDLRSRCLRDNEDSYRLCIRQRGDQGDKFGLLKRGPSGEVVEVTRSQTEMATIT